VAAAAGDDRHRSRRALPPRGAVIGTRVTRRERPAA
jgi:hypothetical protein